MNINTNCRARPAKLPSKHTQIGHSSFNTPGLEYLRCISIRQASGFGCPSPVEHLINLLKGLMLFNGDELY